MRSCQEARGDYATHVLRTLQDYAASWGLSIAILFVDLVKAFDRVIRELVLGWPQGCTEDHVAYLCSLGLPEKHAREIASIIDKGVVLDEICVHPHIKELLASMHTKSWFKVSGGSEYLVVGKGGRQGCMFGGILFNLLYAKALKEFHQRATDEHIPAKLSFLPGRAPDANPTDMRVAQCRRSSST